MKKHYQLIFITAILLSCYACKHNANQQSTAINSSAYIDSLRYKNQSIYIEQIDSNDYLKLAAPTFAWFDAWDLPDYGKGTPGDTMLVYYKDTICSNHDNPADSLYRLLTIKTQNGGAVKLLSSRGYPEYYYYVKEINELNSYLVVFATADDLSFLLVNKTNGQQSVLNGYPVISPDGKTICCVPRQCNGGDFCVSFYVYSFSDSNAILQCEKRDTFIGNPDLKWKDNHTLYMKIIQPAEVTADNKISEQKTWYAKLRLPEFVK